MQRGIVWVVDDDSSIRWVLERALTGAGLSCTTFESGSEVLDALTTKTPDVLLSDIRMPGMDGLALLKQIKQRHPMLPVIIMTAHSDLDAAVSAYQQGAFDYLPKPFDIDEAVALVERAISLSGAAAAAPCARFWPNDRHHRRSAGDAGRVSHYWPSVALIHQRID
jgi:two-component system nitrogen regulation response regulator GlnG